MALIKNYNFKGVDCNYWKIIKIDNDILNNRMTIAVALYASKTVRQRDINNIIYVQTYEVQPCNMTIQEIYAKLKEPIMDIIPRTGESIDVNKLTNAEDDLQ